MKKLEHVNVKMTLKEIAEVDPSLEPVLFKLGFNTCCSKMETFESFAQEKNIDLKKALDILNSKIDEINTISEILENNN